MFFIIAKPKTERSSITYSDNKKEKLKNLEENKTTCLLVSISFNWILDLGLCKNSNSAKTLGPTKRTKNILRELKNVKILHSFIKSNSMWEDSPMISMVPLVIFSGLEVAWHVCPDMSFLPLFKIKLNKCFYIHFSQPRFLTDFFWTRQSMPLR